MAKSQKLTLFGRRRLRKHRYLLFESLLDRVLELFERILPVEKLANFLGKMVLVFEQKGELARRGVAGN
jgi:hypothetical protein